MTNLRYGILLCGLCVLVVLEYISECPLVGKGGFYSIHKLSGRNAALPLQEMNVMIEKRKPLAATGLNDDDEDDDVAVNCPKAPDVSKKILQDSGDWRRILQMKSTGFHSFNATASDLVGKHREDLMDTRNYKCKHITYDTCNLPTTTVIIVFHNEAWSTLLRSVHSVLARTPPNLIVEILLIDDCSTFKWLKEPLQDYVNHLPKVVLIRLESRQGLIKARLRGAREAKGEILYFTDAHTEVNVGWLQPLLARIVEDRKVVVVPYVDPINWESLEYERVLTDYHGAFDWNMEYFYKMIPGRVFNARKNLSTDPIPSPTMIGCAHAVEKKYFFETGSYDESMEIWGGENIEHAFRIWMCGGRVEVLPCSKIGHVFKPHLPYSFGEKSEMVIQRNMIRVAEVWMDDYKKYYYATQDRLAPVDVRSIFKRKRLRRKLRCKSFDWYMKNIIPEMPIPPEDSRNFGKIMRYANTDDCIVKDFENRTLKVVPCEPQRWKNVSFVISEKGHFRFNNVCIGVDDNSLKVDLKCESGISKWAYDYKTHHVYIMNTELCLQYKPGSKRVILTKCREDDKNQWWTFEVTLHFERQQNVLQTSVEHLRLPPAALRFGQLTNVQEQYCLHVLHLRKYEMVPCEDQPSYNHVVHIDTDKRLVFENSCLIVINGTQLVFSKCDLLNKSQQVWDYHTDTLHLTAIINNKTSLCLTFNRSEGRNMYLSDCDDDDLFQTWTI